MKNFSQKPQTVGVGSRVFGVVFFLFFLLMGLAFTGFLGYEIYKDARTYFWQERPCEIISSEVKEDRKKDAENPYFFRVQYRYSVNGNKYFSNSYSRKENGFAKYREAQELVDKFQPDRPCSCYVSPEQPGNAILERNSLWFAFFLCLPLIFVAVGAGGIYFSVRGGSLNAEKTTSISEKAKAAGEGKFLVVFFAIFFLVGAGATYPFFVKPLLQIVDAQNWRQTICTVISSEVKSHSDSDSGTTYSVDILYSYQVAGKEYKSNDYRFMQGSSSGYSGKRNIVRQHPSGKEITCYYNPKNPYEAVIDRGFHLGLLLGLIPVVFMLVGLGGIVFTLRHTRKGGAQRQKSGRVSSAEHSLPRTESQFQYMQSGTIDPGGPVTLKPQASPMVKLIGITLFAVIWNAIITFPISEAIESHNTGNPDWVLTIFMIPFALVGLGTIIGVFYCFLSLFNPRPRLTLSKGRVLLGDSITIEWHISGRTSRIKQLRIDIEGREEATYRRGTSTYTDKETFINIPVKETTLNAEMAMGNAVVAIPADAMHSFEGGNNTIIWVVKLHGVIDRWPDIMGDFPLTVLPAKD